VAWSNKITAFFRFPVDCRLNVTKAPCCQTGGSWWQKIGFVGAGGSGFIPVITMDEARYVGILRDCLHRDTDEADFLPPTASGLATG